MLRFKIGDRTSFRSILSVIIPVIKQIGLPRTRMITNRIHSLLIALFIRKYSKIMLQLSYNVHQSYTNYGLKRLPT